ncbi:MAG: aminotransferase class V-fold PLP-dependent enzyme [Candidatus Eisenbacteria bacterium]
MKAPDRSAPIAEPPGAPTAGAQPLDPDAATLHAWLASATDYVERHLANLDAAPSSATEGAAQLAARVAATPLPAEGRPLDEVIALLDPLIRASLTTPGPGYLAYIPGGGIPTAAIADLIACATNRYVTVDLGAPALAELERTALRRLAEMMGMPAGANGIFTSGGSLSNLAALVAARADRLGEDFTDGTLYYSADTHACVAKAARVAGFPGRALREVPVDERRRLRVDALARMIEEDRAAGRRPFCVVANAGTTNTGAIDPLPEILERARAHGLWAHVDGAYGGLFRIAEGGDALLPRLGEFDSLTLDPHKCLFLPYGTGALLVRDPETLRHAHAATASYLQDVTQDAPLGWTDYSPELSRDFRGLRVWLPFMVHGVDAFRAQLTEKLALTRWAHERLAAEPLFDIYDAPQLSVIAFSARPPAGHRLDANAFSAEVLRRVNARKRVFMSSTTIDGRYLLRICVVSFRTHADRMRDAVSGLIEEARALAAGG